MTRPHPDLALCGGQSAVVRPVGEDVEEVVRTRHEVAR